MTLRAWLRCGAAVLIRPSLWLTALRQYRAVLPRRWWANCPRMPVPPADYVAFRLETQYGSGEHNIAVTDVLNYLSWCKLHRTLAS